MSSNEVHDSVRDYYRKAAERVDHTGRNEGKWGASQYDEAILESDVGSAAAQSMGCGNPYAMAELCQGETVLDLGSGGGLDVILSAK